MPPTSIHPSFHPKGERDYNMQVACEATQKPSDDVQVGAFEGPVRIMSLYYDEMGLYMEQAAFGVRRFFLCFGLLTLTELLQSTIVGMKNPYGRAALQVVEDWSTVCEEEVALSSESQEVSSSVTV